MKILESNSERERNILKIIKSSLHSKIKTKEKNTPSEFGRMKTDNSEC